jgi:hypothetical protein
MVKGGQTQSAPSKMLKGREVIKLEVFNMKVIITVKKQLALQENLKFR